MGRLTTLLRRRTDDVPLELTASDARPPDAPRPPSHAGPAIADLVREVECVAAYQAELRRSICALDPWQLAATLPALRAELADPGEAIRAVLSAAEDLANSGHEHADLAAPLARLAEAARQGAETETKLRRATDLLLGLERRLARFCAAVGPAAESQDGSGPAVPQPDEAPPDGDRIAA